MPELFESLTATTWVKIGLLMLLIDMILVSGVFISVSVGALIVGGLTAHFHINTEYQVAIFCALSCLMGMVLWMRRKAPTPTSSNNPLGETLIGRTCQVRKDETANLTVYLAESLWECTVAKDIEASVNDIETNSVVEIVGIQGATLIIKPVLL